MSIVGLNWTYIKLDSAYTQMFSYLCCIPKKNFLNNVNYKFSYRKVFLKTMFFFLFSHFNFRIYVSSTYHCGRCHSVLSGNLWWISSFQHVPSVWYAESNQACRNSTSVWSSKIWSHQFVSSLSCLCYIKTFVLFCPVFLFSWLYSFPRALVTNYTN